MFLAWAQISFIVGQKKSRGIRRTFLWDMIFRFQKLTLAAIHYPVSLKGRTLELLHPMEVTPLSTYKAVIDNHHCPMLEIFFEKDVPPPPAQHRRYKFGSRRLFTIKDFIAHVELEKTRHAAKRCSRSTFLRHKIFKPGIKFATPLSCYAPQKLSMLPSSQNNSWGEASVVRFIINVLNVLILDLF